MLPSQFFQTTLFFVIVYNRPAAAKAFSEEGNYPTRIVTDLEIIYGSYGVPIQYWYNETRANDDIQLASVPGCPESIDEFPWVYYGTPPRCFLAGHHGPCPFGEKLMIETGSLFGVCACDCFVDRPQGDRYSLFLPDDTRRYLQCYSKNAEASRYGQLYDRMENKCYGLFKRGPCPEGTVVTGYTNDSVECLPICNKVDKNWTEQRDKGFCKPEPCCFGLGGSANSIIPNENCEEMERYSRILKKCIKQFKANPHIG